MSPAHDAGARRPLVSRAAQRAILLTAGVLFGVFFVVAFAFRRLDVSQETLSIVGGALAYAFLLAVAVIVVRGWRRRSRDAAGAAQHYVEGHAMVAASIGVPVRVGRPEGEATEGRGATQANLAVPVSGPGGEGTVDLVMARLGRRWEVLSATLVVDGDRVALADGPPEATAGED